jgi:hypothetical protein
VGGVQRIDNQQEHAGPAELFTLRMRAVSPGVAVFQADPADTDDQPISETVVLGSDVALLPRQLRLGTTELLILPDSDNFTSAIDDSFPDGLDSNGNPIVNSSVNRNRLDVLRNDNLGPTGIIREFGLVTSPTKGNVFIDDNGTPGNLNDDFFSYRANTNANGLDSFTYLIVTDDNVRSTAEVTLALGNQNSNSQVAYDFALVAGDGSGNALTSGIRVGDRFGVQVYVEDLRVNSTFVFAGFLDLLYDSGIINPADTRPGDGFDFDVDFGPGYVEDAAVGTAARPGIIDEFGTLYERASFPNNNFDDLNPGLLATIYFDAVNVGTARVAGSPADFSPFQDTLLFGEDDPIDRSRLRFESLQITVGAGAPLQNRSLPQDVNNDGTVSPIDALLIINQMNRFGTSAEGESAAAAATNLYFTDVNGDSTTSALDALQVINYLTRASKGSANGEQIALLSQTVSGSSSEETADDVFASLGGDDAEKLVSSGDSSQAAVEQLPMISSNNADEDDEDILSLLADDVSGLWS